jgi:N-acylneuraminate cytidylyltransferase
MNIAIIPARGGSKRIPRKNIKLFRGTPVIAYAIRAAEKSGVFDKIFVSTDDNEIAEVAIRFGASLLPMRSIELSDDHATTLDVMKDAVINLDQVTSVIGNVCCIYPVTPLLKSNSLVEGLRILESGDLDYVISGLRVSQPPQRAFVLDDFRIVKMLSPEHIFTRTQDLKPAYQDAGQFYWGKKNSWISGSPIFSSKSTILELPIGSVIDIDTVTDWELAEKLFKQQKISKNGT